MISVSRGPDASPTGTLSLVEAYATHGPTGQAAYILTGSGAKRKLGGRFGTGEMTIKVLAKFCSVAALAVLVFAALGPAKWQLRTGLGWQIDHFVAYFAVTPIVCLAWPRPFVVGGALMVIGALLEGLQAFTPDRTPDVRAALYGASGALAAALLAELFIRARRAAWAQAIEMRT